MEHQHIAMIVTFVFYLIGLLAIGYFGEKKFSKSYEDFVSAGKSLGAFVTALSSSASSESAWVMLGLSGLGYAKGTAAYWSAIGCVLGFAFNWLFVISPVRRISGKYNSLTMADMIEDALDDRKKVLRIISSLIIVVFMSTYVVAQFNGAGKTLHGMGLMSYESGVWLGSIIIGIYVLLGGYAAVCWTDALQGVLMAVIMIGLPILAVFYAGGISNIYNALEVSGLNTFFTVKGMTGWGSLGFIIGALGIGLGYPGMPHVIVRYITVKDEEEGDKSGKIATLWGAFVLFGSVTLGIAGRALFPELADAEQILPKFAASYLHPILGGIVLAAITAAIMSTADSQLMYAATSLVNDLWLKITNKKIDSNKLVIVTRLVIVALTAIAIYFALRKNNVIYSFVLYAWGAMGSAFGPLILLMIYYKNFNKWGALSNLIVGPVTVVVWSSFPHLKQAVYELIPAFFLSLIVGIVISKLTGGSGEHTRAS